MQSYLVHLYPHSLEAVSEAALPSGMDSLIAGDKVVFLLVSRAKFLATYEMSKMSKNLSHFSHFCLTFSGAAELSPC